MMYTPDKHRRRSLRLHHHDYSAQGMYFITICVQGRGAVFGAVAGDMVHLNRAGAMVFETWLQLPQRFPSVELDAVVVMPDHVHALIGLASDTSVSVRLGDVVGAFKSLSTVAYIQGVRSHRWPAFDRRLWQRNYYEHIVRDEADLQRIRRYIAANPARWPK